ncbi:MAG: NAD(P)H-dependent glycerol-3-phosphate dehydrogenase [Pseudomonadota bacterium]
MSRNLNNIAIIGAGAWGTALAHILAEAGRAVVLYVHEPELVDSINKNHQNDLYLPDVSLNSHVRATSVLAEVMQDAGIILLATPTQFVRNILIKIEPHLPEGVPLVNCAKGIEMSTGRLLSEVVAEVVPESPYAVLSGPTFAGEVVRGLPTAVTFATGAPEQEARLWAQKLSGKGFRLYLSRDPVGAEISGAIKNVIAIACGIVEGKGLGQNAKASVITRGMAEIRRLGVKKGAEVDTFLGLSGLGDLTLTCNSMTSRNYSLGFELGRGRKLADILAERRTVAEGVTTAKAIAAHAHALGVEMPISAAVDKILHQAAGIDAVILSLLSRDMKQESR